MDSITKTLSISQAGLKFYKLAKDLKNENEVFEVLDDCFHDLFENGSISILLKGQDGQLTNIYSNRVDKVQDINHQGAFLKFINSSNTFFSISRENEGKTTLACFLRIYDESLTEYIIELIFKDLENWRENDELILEMIADSLKTRFLQTEALKNLRESLAKFQSVFKNNIFGITIVNPDRSYEMVNPAFCKMLGYSLEEIMGLDFAKVTHMKNLDESIEKFNRLRDGEYNYYEFEKVFIKKDKSLSYCHTSVSGIFDENNNLQKVIYTIKDITHEKKHLQSLQESQERYKKIFESNVIPVFVYDYKKNKIDANPALRKLVEYSSKEFNDLRMYDLVTSPGKKQLDAILEDFVIHDKDEMLTKFIFKRSDSKPIKTIINLKALRSETGNLDGIIGTIKDLTDTEMAIESVQRTELKYHSLFENTKAGIMLMDSDFNFSAPNPEICNMLGYSKMEILNLSIEDLLSPQDQIIAIENLRNLKTGAISSFSMECYHKRKDGSTIWGIVTVNGMYKDGILDEIFVNLVDGTDLRKAQELLLESEHKYKLLFNNQAAGIINYDSDWKFVTANKTFVQMLGYTLQDLSQMSISDFTEKSYLDQLVWVKEMIQEGHREDIFIEKVYIKKNGQKMYAMTSVKALFNTAGQFDGAIATVIDIDEKKKAQEKEKISELKYQTIFDNSQFGIFIYEAETRKIKSLNEACLKMFGFKTAKSVEGKDINIFFPELQSRGIPTSTFLRKYFKYFIENKEVQMEMELKKKNGEIFFSKVQSFFMPPDMNYVVNIIEDITKEKQVKMAEAETRAKQIELDAKNRELASYTLFLTQKNQSLDEISQQLKDLSKLDNSKIKAKMMRLANKINLGLNKQEDWLSFRIYFENIYPSFFDHLISKYQNLTHNEQRLCAYLKMKLSNREISNLLHISIKAVETAKYRLKKKIELGPKINLNEFINNLESNGSPS